MKRIFIKLFLVIFVIELTAQINYKTSQEYENTAKNYLEEGDIETAIRIYNEGIDKFPNDSNLLSGLAYVNMSIGKKTIAIQFFKKSIEIDPTNDIAHYYLGCIYTTNEEFYLARTYISKAIELSPEVSYYWSQRGKIYFLIDEFNNSITDFEEAISLNPQDDESLSLLAYIYYKYQDYYKALSLAKNALEINSSNEFAKSILESAEEKGISLEDSKRASVHVTLIPGITIDEYLNKFPYLEAVSTTNLKDTRASFMNMFIDYYFEDTSKRITMVVLSNYAEDRYQFFNNYLTEWMKKENDLDESKDGQNHCIFNNTPIVDNETIYVFLALTLTNEKAMLHYIITYK